MSAAALAFLSAGFGAGLAVIGAGLGIGKLAAAALGDIRTTMIIAAALIEGVTLFAIVVCVLLAIKAG